SSGPAAGTENKPVAMGSGPNLANGMIKFAMQSNRLKPIRIFSANAARSVMDELLGRPISTDYIYLAQILPKLAEFQPIDFTSNQSLLAALRLDAMRVGARLLPFEMGRSLIEAIAKPVEFSVPKNVPADAVYTYGCSVQGPCRLPIVYNDVFCP